MKNLKIFEDHVWEMFDSGLTKDYGEKFPIDKISIGDNVTYSGMPCEVIEANPYALKLRTTNGTNMTYLVNQNMFNQKGFISGKLKNTQ